MNKKIIVGIAIIFLVLAGLFIFTKSNASAYTTLGSYNENIEIYKSSTCGCCNLYVDYFKEKGNSKVNAAQVRDTDAIKKKYGVPAAMESCHTTIIGNYFIEGHVPLEAAEKLLLEKPNIKGIAMPGMPNGSPGMPYSKSGDFVVYAVNNDGSYDEFMRI